MKALLTLVFVAAGAAKPIGAVIAHLAILGPSVVPAPVLGVLSAVLLWTHRHRAART